MLTREGERACEVLLIAAGLALALVFQSGFPGAGPSADTESAQAGQSVFLDRVRDLNFREMLRSSNPGAQFLPTGSIGQAPNEAALRAEETERHIGRC